MNGVVGPGWVAGCVVAAAEAGDAAFAVVGVKYWGAGAMAAGVAELY